MTGGIFTGWGFGLPEKPERQTEYLRYVAAGPAFATAWKEMEEGMLPPSWEVFMYGYMQHKKLNAKASAINYAKQVVLWGERDDGVGNA